MIDRLISPTSAIVGLARVLKRRLTVHMQAPLSEAIRGERPGNDAKAREESPRTMEKSPVRTVLVVDDDPLFRWAIGQTLENGGYAVVEAGDARSALAAFLPGARPVAVVFLDLRLPDSADLHVLSTLHRLAPSTPVILMTSFGSGEVSATALALGAFAVVDKPFELRIVLSLVERALSVRPH
jgi:CheY-like chemotaxis protein